MINRDEYKPINCSYYDILEAHATTGNLIKITIKKEDEGIQEYSDRIINLKSKKGEEFAIMESGKVVRLDNIVAINGVSPKQPPFNTDCIM
ncbi:MAG: hypothetical protein HKN68_07740 [Saprospiraceae bacterium]|nr:hypothetical protein [Saprospiraceae bacterium]